MLELPGESHLDSAFLGAVTTNRNSSWTTTINMNGLKTTFKLDTGAEVTGITGNTFQEMRNVNLRMSGKILYGPSNQPLSVMGQFQGKFIHKDRDAEQTVYVVRGLKISLMGLLAIITLNLASRVDAITEVNYDTKM